MFRNFVNRTKIIFCPNVFGFWNKIFTTKDGTKKKEIKTKREEKEIPINTLTD